MLDVWTITDKYIFGYDKNIILPNYLEQDKIYFFDLDSTLIKTKSGKKFQTDNNDWKFINDNVISIINNMNGCNIITNQNGLKTPLQIENWIQKIKSINKFIKINSIFASIKTSIYRKPMDKSLVYISNQIYPTLFDKIKNKKVYYVGDACGRNDDYMKDFSDTDIKFALNNKLRFRLPEQIFKYGQITPCYVSYPILNYYTNDEYLNILNMLKEKINENNKCLIMMIGLPASGKTYLRKVIIDNYPNFKFVNSDMKLNKNTISTENNLLFDNMIYSHNNTQNITHIIDDNTNLDFTKRQLILDEYKNYYKIAIVFTHNIDVCTFLNYMRMYKYDVPLISLIAYRTMKKKYPNYLIYNFNLQFDFVIKINKLFPELTGNLLYYY